MKRVEFVYEDEKIIFGNYDLMYPQTTDNKTIRSSFNGDSTLKQYFNEYVSWLISIGFTKKEITEQMNRFCNYTDEISTSL